MIESLVAFSQEYKKIFLVSHLFAVVIGLGGATYTDILLVKFLKDFKIDAKEAEIIHTMSKTVQAGVVLALISGVMLFLSDPEVILQKSKFQAKIIIFGIIMMNGYCLHKIVLPRLINFSFKKEHYLISKLIHLRQVGFILGAISGVSWYSVFLLGGFKNISFSLNQMMSWYGIIIILGIITSLSIERFIKKQTK